MDNEEVFFNDLDNFQSRPYQDELLLLAIKENTIIYLPTGSGKTHIAMLAIRHFSKDLAKSLDEGGKRTVFVANTVVLAHQQAASLQKTLSLKTTVYTGDMNVDNWKKEKWRNEFEKFQIIVATCQIIVDVIRHGFISVADLNVIVFDECHHGIGDHPMHQLMSQFETVPVNKHPRVIGLTGMLLSGKVTPQTIITQLEQLENIFRAVIRTVSSTKTFYNVLAHSTHPEEFIVSYETQQKSETINKITLIVEKYISDIADWPTESLPASRYVQVDESNLSRYQKNKASSTYKKYLNDFLYQMNDFGIYGASIAILSVLIDLELAKRAALTTSQINLLRHLITGTTVISKILSKVMANLTVVEQIQYFGSPKLKQLILFLENRITTQGTADLKGLIFVQRRYTAKCLYHILRIYADAKEEFTIKSDFMVGINNRIPESIESILEQKWNRRALERFRKGEINLIVASSVLEEGVDLQMCNLVISYDTPQTFRSYVQSKGRARMANSKYAIMLNGSEQTKVVGQLRQFREVEKLLREFLIGKSIDRRPPLEENISNELYNHAIPPFITKGGAKLEALPAIQLLNRYCQQLPKDRFSSGTLLWTERKLKDGNFVVQIELPVQSKIKHTVEGTAFKKASIAKRSAAFNACKELYFNGELNELLLPINAEKNLLKLEDEYFSHWPQNEFESSNSKKKVGLKSNYRMHEILYPKQLVDCRPTIGIICYLYKISFTPACKTYTTPADQVFNELLSGNRCFGILSSKQLPRLPVSQLFLSTGEVHCEFASEPILLRLNSDNDIHELQQFHSTIFRNVLQIFKNFFVFDNRSEENSYLVVPMVGDVIDWILVTSYQYVAAPDEVPIYKRRLLEFDRDDYMYTVITPWYRIDPKPSYIVVGVKENMSPQTPFPNPEFGTFANYYESKYQQVVTHANQFLIEAKGITSKLNRLNPIDPSKVKKTFGSETLIPELCHNFMFPGELWLKAVLLPSALHRLHYMLNAENMRSSIMSFIGINDVNYVPEPLDVDKRVQTDSEKEKKPQNCKNILTPQPDNVVVKNLTTPTFKSLTEILDCPWMGAEEPLDLQRHWNSTYPVDLDYFHYFMGRMSKANQDLSAMNLGSDEVPEEDFLMICDDPEAVGIKLLNVKQIVSPQTKDFLKAITATSASDVFDMERFEFLGDSYLKMFVSIFAYQNFDDWHEGKLTIFRSKLISNENLLYAGIKREIGSIIKTIAFDPKNDWLPPLITVPRTLRESMIQNNLSCNFLYKLQLTNEEIRSGIIDADKLELFIGRSLCDYNEADKDVSSINNFLLRQNISDKAVADCVEAVIGVCVETLGIANGARILQYFNILPASVNLLDILERPIPCIRNTPNVLQSDIDDLLINYRDLEMSLGYTFKDRGYLLQALTHASYSMNRFTQCYQQLEFLGDAILDFLIAAHIYEKCRDMDPGNLTDLRSALVNNTTLACIAVRNKFHLYMLYNNSVLSEIIAQFVTFQERQNNQVCDQVQLLIDEHDFAISDYIDVPKALGDLFEALIGAVFLDSGKSFHVTWNVIYRLMEKEINEFMHDIPYQLVRQLMEFPHANPKFGEPVAVGEHKVMVEVRFTRMDEILQVSGFGKNKQDAKKSAAKLALQKLKLN